MTINTNKPSGMNNRSTSLEPISLRNRSVPPFLLRSASFGSKPTETSLPVLTAEQEKQVNFLDALGEVLKRFYPNDDFTFLDTFKDQVKQKDNFNSEKFKKDLNKKLFPYNLIQDYYDTFEMQKFEMQKMDKKDNIGDYLFDNISVNVKAEYLLTYKNFIVELSNKKHNLVENKFLIPNITTEWCSNIFKKFEDLSGLIREHDRKEICTEICRSKDILRTQGLYAPEKLNNITSNISSEEFFNHLIPFDLLKELRLASSILAHNINYSDDLDRVKKDKNKIILADLKSSFNIICNLQKKRMGLVYTFTSDKKIPNFTNPQDQKDYIFSTGKYAATEEHGATGLLEVIQDSENTTSYVKDALKIKEQLEGQNIDLQKDLANNLAEEKAKKVAEELLADEASVISQTSSKASSKKSAKGGKQKRNQSKTTITQDTTKSLINKYKRILKSLPQTDDPFENMNRIESLEGFIEVEYKKKRIPMGEYNIPTLNEFIKNKKFVSLVNPSKDEKNLSIIKLKKNDNTTQDVKIYLSKYSPDKNAFINHIKQKHPEFYDWANRNFNNTDDDNLAQKLLKTALDTLQEGKGEVSITNNYIDDSGTQHDVQALQIQIPLNGQEVVLRLQKDQYKRLVLVTAFDKNMD